MLRLLRVIIRPSSGLIQGYLNTFLNDKMSENLSNSFLVVINVDQFLSFDFFHLRILNANFITIW